mgnify:CR=1 FL=1
MDKKIKELIEGHESNLENLFLITDYSVRCLYESLVSDLVDIFKEEEEEK